MSYTPSRKSLPINGKQSLIELQKKNYRSLSTENYRSCTSTYISEIKCNNGLTIRCNTDFSHLNSLLVNGQIPPPSVHIDLSTRTCININCVKNNVTNNQIKKKSKFLFKILLCQPRKS